MYYKYMSRSTGRIVLENRTLRWSSPGTLNDPYDMQFDLHIELDQAAVKAAALQKMWDAFYTGDSFPIKNPIGLLLHLYKGRLRDMPRAEFDGDFGKAIDMGFDGMLEALPRLQADVRAMMATSKILCLTDTPNNKIMWAHYSEQNQGICLKFRMVDGLDSPWRLAKAVKYTLSMPRLMNEDFFADLVSGRTVFDGATILDHMVYTKSEEWAYERELRIFFGNGHKPETYYEDIGFHELELDEVIFGCRMAAEDQSAFISCP
jgi:hypothetical protein